MRKRVPIWKNGGKLTSANLMARYVDPHTIHVAARHAMTREEERCEIIDQGCPEPPVGLISFSVAPLQAREGDDADAHPDNVQGGGGDGAVVAAVDDEAGGAEDVHQLIGH